jgi:hypothetical protein
MNPGSQSVLEAVWFHANRKCSISVEPKSDFTECSG